MELVTGDSFSAEESQKCQNKHCKYPDPHAVMKQFVGHMQTHAQKTGTKISRRGIIESCRRIDITISHSPWNHKKKFPLTEQKYPEMLNHSN
jgi:hypothetical protein